MATPYHSQQRDVQLALTEFSTEFDRVLALADVNQWSRSIGFVKSSDAIRTTFPIPIGAAGYKLRKGDDALRRLYARSLSMITQEWVDGVEEEARILRAADFIGWGQAPAEMALEAQRFANVLVADVLASNAYLDFYREEHPGGSTASAKALFASGHPHNVLNSSKYGTFDNDWGNGDSVQGETVPTEINRVLVKQLRQHFRAIKGPNGRPLGLQLAGLLITPTHEEAALDVTQRDTTVTVVGDATGTANVAAVTQTNRYKGLTVVVADELVGDLPSGASGDVDTIYAWASRGSATPTPWVIQDAGMEEIVYDESDAKYKDEGKVGVKRVLTMAAAGCLPHAIVRINLSV